MPIKIPDNLPARATLEHEGVAVMSERTASRQDIRPLQIGLLNLMPKKIITETQIARLVGASPLQVEFTLVKIGNHVSKNTGQDHMLAFYEDFQAIQDRHFDGFIVTGAPVELLEFNSVNYWSELGEIFDWTQSHVHSTLNICWGAQAAINHFHNVPKHKLADKSFGVFRHNNLQPSSPYLRGFSDDFSIPVSRHTEVRRADLPKDAGLEVLMESDEAGLCLINDPAHRQLYMFNHLEYDSHTLADEYHRDAAAGKKTAVPANYFPNDNPDAEPINHWRSHAHLLFGNWINEIYQTVPFDLRDIGK
jgi:homoserine O-succinyltransferase